MVAPNPKPLVTTRKVWFHTHVSNAAAAKVAKKIVSDVSDDMKKDTRKVGAMRTRSVRALNT